MEPFLLFLGALLLDLLLGDPRWMPHPVRAMGVLAQALEGPARRCIPQPRLAGVAVSVVLLVLFAGLAGGLTWMATGVHPACGWIVTAYLVYTAIAPRDLARHARDVADALYAGDLPEARRRVGMLVGRDTDVLDETGVARAAIESVGENLVDGVTAALFYGAVGYSLGGAVGAAAGAVFYRASNTLDATFGYRNERYALFGWAAARWDDVLNLLPARLTVPFMSLAALLAGGRTGATVRISLRDGRKHASPNSAVTEAAMAGALGVQLGGPTVYGGEVKDYPLLGDPVEALTANHIERANRIVVLATFFFTLAAVGSGWVVRMWIAG